MKKVICSMLKYFIIYIFFSFLIPSISSFAQKSEDTGQRTIKVGITDFSIFSQEMDGVYSGIICDYMNEIAKYTGWEIEYVTGEIGYLTDRLSDGSIDLMGVANKTDETMEMFDLAELPSGYAYSVLATKKNNTKYVTGDYNAITEDMRVGIYTRSLARKTAFEQFCSTNDIQVTPVYYDDAGKWEASLENGEVDAILTNSSKLKSDEKIIVNFKKETYYFAVTKGKSDIIRGINIALEKIELINPQFEASTYKKYLNNDSENEILLTTEENAYVTEHPVLKVVTAPDWLPISYYDKSTDSYHGISVDILEQIAESTGLKLEYIKADSFEECLKMLASGEADLLNGIYDTGFISKFYDITLSIPYLPTQILILHRKDVKLENLSKTREITLAMPYGFDYNHSFKNCTVKYYDTVDDCIDAVKKGNVDFSAISSLAVEQYIQTKGKGNLVMVPVATSTMELSLAFKSPTNPQLISIVDKAIYSITEAEKQSIMFKNTSFENKKLTFLSLVYSNPTQVVAITFVICFLLMMLLFIIMHIRLRLNQNIALNAEAYGIIEELSDEYLFEYDFVASEMRLPNKFAKLVKVRCAINSTDQLSEGLEKLFSAFNENKTNDKFTVEFKCVLNTGIKERFRAICVILSDSSGKPVRGIGKIINIQADFEEKHRLNMRANTDSLTGLHNKRYCEEVINELFSDSTNIENAAILLIDLDHFKAVNDILGHLGGDEALNYFACILKEVFPNQEVLGRWGGDEFFVFMKNISGKDYLIEKTKMLCLAMDTAFRHGDLTHKLSISAGGAFTTDNFNYQTMFLTADEALYVVKNNTRNGYKIVEC